MYICIYVYVYIYYIYSLKFLRVNGFYNLEKTLPPTMAINDSSSLGNGHGTATMQAWLTVIL